MIRLRNISIVLLFLFPLSAHSAFLNRKNATIQFYYGPTIKDSVSYPVKDAQEIGMRSEFWNLKTVLIIPDYYEPEEERMEDLINTYLGKQINILRLNWGAKVVPEAKTKSQENIDMLASDVSNWLNEMHSLMSWKYFSIVAYLRGNEFVSNVVVLLNREHKIRVLRITQLNPPKTIVINGEKFTDIEEKNFISEFEDAIHTDIPMNETTSRRAHVVCYPNGGFSPQPGCCSKADKARGEIFCSSEETCSRGRALEIWTESLTNKYALCGIKADSYKDYKALDGKCRGRPAYIGFTYENVTGKYYLDTNATPLYGIGC